MIGYSIGFASISMVGALVVQWRLVVAPLALVATMGLVGALFMHDSPEWLLKKGYREEAIKAWDFYHPGDSSFKTDGSLNKLHTTTRFAY